MADATALGACSDRVSNGSRDAVRGGAQRVVLLHADTRRRELLGDALRAAGFLVSEFASVAEMERWPVAEIVVTDLRHLTGWWKSVGARHVVVLTDTRSSGRQPCASVADAWIVDHGIPDSLVELVQHFFQSAIRSHN